MGEFISPQEKILERLREGPRSFAELGIEPPTLAPMTEKERAVREENADRGRLILSALLSGGYANVRAKRPGLEARMARHDLF